VPTELTPYFKIFKPNYVVQGNTTDLCFLTAHGVGRSSSPRSFTVPKRDDVVVSVRCRWGRGRPPIVLGNVNAFNANFSLVRLRRP